MPQTKISAVFMHSGTSKAIELHERDRAAGREARAPVRAPRPSGEDDLRRADLEAERLRQAAINAYPAPIPACDVYFNDLLEQRSRICARIDEMRDAMRGAGRGSDPMC